MRIRGAVVVLAVLVATTAFGASMVRAEVLSKGTIELTPSLSFSHNSLSFTGSDAGSLTTLVGSGVVGYCVSDRVEIGGGLLVNHQSLSDPGFGSASLTSIGFTGGVQFNFAGSGQTVPFVRGAIGVLTNSGDLAVGEETTFVAPILQGGLRVFVGPSASVNFGLGYSHQSSALGLRDLSANTFALEIGVSVFPHRGQ